MSSCKYCGGLGLFFSISGEGLCAACQPLVTMDVEQRVRIVEAEAAAADRTLNPQSKIDRLDQVVHNLNALADYEKKGIRTLNGEAGERLEESRKALESLILKTASAEVKDCFRKVRAEREAERKLKRLSHCLLRLQEHEERLGPRPALSALTRKAQNLSHRIQLHDEMARGVRAEQVGLIEQARAHYQQALNHLKAAGDGASPADSADLEARLRGLSAPEAPKARD